MIGVPLLAKEKAFGSLNIYSQHQNPFSKDEVQLLCDLAVDLSFGIVAIRQRIAHAKAESALRLIGAADKALYRAKANGRNRVTVE